MTEAEDKLNIEVSTKVFKYLVQDLNKCLKRKFIQALGFSCYLAQPKNKQIFINDLSMNQIWFVLQLHGLLNKDIALCLILKDLFDSDQNFYSELQFHTVEFEFWVRTTFKLFEFQVKSALDYASELRSHKILLIPKSIYTILSGYISRVKLRPEVREMLGKEKLNETEPEEEKENELTFGENILAIASAEETTYDNDNTSIIKRQFLFVKKEEKPDYNAFDKCPHLTPFLKRCTSELKNKVLSGLRLACAASIYNQSYTLTSLEDPFKRQYILWLYGLIERDTTIFALATNILAFGLSAEKNIQLPKDSKDWLQIQYMFPKNKLKSAAHFLRKLQFTNLFYIVPSLEELFGDQSIIHNTIKIHLRDIVDGKIKRTRGKRKKKGGKTEIPENLTEIDSEQQITTTCTTEETLPGYPNPEEELGFNRDGNEGETWRSEGNDNGGNSTVEWSWGYHKESQDKITTEIQEPHSTENTGKWSEESPVSKRGRYEEATGGERKTRYEEETKDPEEEEETAMRRKKTDPEGLLREVEEMERRLGEVLRSAAERGETQELMKMGGGGERGRWLLRDTRCPLTGGTLLHIATRGGEHEETVEYLLQFLDGSAQDREGRTALHLAAQYGRAIVAEILLEAGASPTVRDSQGRTPHDVALALGKKRLANKLVDKNNREG